MLQTGSQFPGLPSMGAWLNYGLGSENENLPSFVVMVTKGKGGQPLVSRLWGSGFLPSKHQGVRFRSGKDPVLYLSNPEGIDSEGRRLMLATEVIIKPLITEKATFGSTELNRYAFQVVPHATKTQIKRAVEELYTVRVLGVSTQNRKGQLRRNRFGFWKSRGMKRAIVRIHTDDRIELF